MEGEILGDLLGLTLGEIETEGLCEGEILGLFDGDTEGEMEGEGELTGSSKRAPLLSSSSILELLSSCNK
jgi:hypothetical protein